MPRLRSLTIPTALIAALQVFSCSELALKQDSAVQVGKARKGLGMEEMMAAWGDSGTPAEEHEMLAKMAGTWDTANRYWLAPDAEPHETPGESVKTLVLGGRFLREEHRSKSEEMPFEGIGYTGFDRVKGKYVNSWIDSMTTFQWTGEAEASEKGYEGAGPMYDPITKSRYDSRYKLILIDENSHQLEFWEPGPDGAYFRAMEIVYTRRR